MNVRDRHRSGHVRCQQIPTQIKQGVARPPGVRRADAIYIRIPVERADIGLIAEGA